MGSEELSMDIPTPWLDHMPEGRATTLDYEKVGMYEFLKRRAKNMPDQKAMILPKGKQITFSEFYQMSRNVASKLQQMGIQKGDRIAIMLNNVPQYPIVHYAAMALGAVVVQVNPLYTAHEMKYIIENSGARVLFTLTMFQDKSNKVLEETDLEFVVYTKIQDMLKWYIRILGKLLTASEIFDKNSDKYEADRKDIPNTYDFDDFQNANDTLVEADVDFDDLAIFQYTGGTTGFPKGAMLTVGNVSSNSQQVRNALHTVPDGEGSVLTVLPMFHSFGLTSCMNLSIILGIPMILNIASPPDFGDIIDWIEKYEITFLPGVPRIFIEINKHPKSADADFSSLIAAISGGAPLPLEVARNFKQITGADLVEGYGLSETSPVASVVPLNAEAKEGSIGPPVPDTFFKIVDIEDDSKVLDVGEVGEIVLKGPQVFKGYWDLPDATAEVLSEDGWFKTGDVGKLDEEGWAYIVDRKKEMVISSGYNVYPAEVEDAIFQHPKVEEAAVAGIPDEKRGEIIAAWVVLKEGEEATEEEILKHCEEFLAPYKVPRRITFRDSLPTSMVGKVLRREILEEEGHVDPITPPED